MKMLLSLLATLRTIFKDPTELALKNLALRQQLAIMKQYIKRPRLRARDRIFWVLLSRLWSNWSAALIVVKPETVVRWHRKGFKLLWAYKSRRKSPGRPPVNPEIRELVLSMAQANPFWGAPRIHGELHKLGINVSERTVSGLIARFRRKPPSQTWRTFLENHMEDMCALDFFTVPTATFRILFALVILDHDRRRIVHFNVNEHPTAEWTARQITEAFPWDTAPKYILRDRDSIYGGYFRQRVKNIGIAEVVTSRKSPWQNPYVVRLIGSIRRECLNHVIVPNQRHLKSILSSYLKYYHEDRSHLSLQKDTPLKRPIQTKPSASSGVIALPRVGGLHHRYEWRDAA